MADLSKEAEGGPSIDVKQEKMDDSSEKAGPSKYELQQNKQRKSHTFQFRFRNNTYAVMCDTSMTVLEALMKSNIFMNIKKKNNKKDIVIQRSKGAVPRAAVKTDFPCCLLERDEILKIQFINDDEIASTEQKPTDTSKPETLVTFYIRTTGGQNIRLLMKNKDLRQIVDYVCVYAFKDEDCITALKCDGRFIDDIFKKHCALFEMDSETIYEMSNTVEYLDQKHFQIIVIGDHNLPASHDQVLSNVSAEINVASADDLKSNADPEHHANTEQEEKQKREGVKSTNTSTAKYSKIIHSEEIRKILCSQFDSLLELLMHRENLKKSALFQTFFRAEYDKSVQSFSEVYKVKQLMSLSNSVCQIRVEGSGRGTGFLLFSRFVLTNAHVVWDFLESPDKLSPAKRVEAAFDFERLDSKVKLVPVKKQLAAYCFITDVDNSRLDFALLELDDVDEIIARTGLLCRYDPGPPPIRGGICIVGHPDGGIKKADPCLIVEDLQKAADKHMSENSFFQMITKKSFKVTGYKNQISYNSCFFHGSSGSPVFDEDCYLIGVHTGGYEYEGEKGKTRSVVEYAYSMQPILDMIRAQAKIKGLHEVVNALEAYSKKSNESRITEQENQTNCEMEVS